MQMNLEEVFVWFSPCNLTEANQTYYLLRLLFRSSNEIPDSSSTKAQCIFNTCEGVLLEGFFESTEFDELDKSRTTRVNVQCYIVYHFWSIFKCVVVEVQPRGPNPPPARPACLTERSLTGKIFSALLLISLLESFRPYISTLPLKEVHLEINIYKLTTVSSRWWGGFSHDCFYISLQQSLL